MITSTANPRVKALGALKDRAERDRTGRFPVEGLRMVRRAMAAGWPIEEIVLAPELAGPEAQATASDSGLSVVELGVDAFRRIAYRQGPDGILAVAVAKPLPLDGLRMTGAGFVLVLEGMEKPGNLGAVLRTADAAGVDAVIAADPATDVYNPNVVRASQGSLFTVPLAVASAQATRQWLRDRGLTIHIARPQVGAPSPWDVDLDLPTGIVVGGERAGVSAVWDGDRAVSIPMRGSADSLNAATAAAIIVYEWVRQRVGAGGRG